MSAHDAAWWRSYRRRLRAGRIEPKPRRMTYDKAVAVRKAYHAGTSVASLARVYRCSKNTIWHIIAERTWYKRPR